MPRARPYLSLEKEARDEVMADHERRNGRLSQIELAQIELRLARATPGPWLARHDQVYASDDVLADICCAALEQSLHDALFISSARGDIERLTREVRALWEELESVRQQGC